MFTERLTLRAIYLLTSWSQKKVHNASFQCHCQGTMGKGGLSISNQALPNSMHCGCNPCQLSAAQQGGIAPTHTAPVPPMDLSTRLCI